VKLFSLASVAFALFLGIAIGWTSGYGGNPDTYGMLSTFLSILHDGVYHPSRYTGYPAAELVVGAMAWLGGSRLTNIASFLFLVVATTLFPLCLSKSPPLGRYLVYCAIALSSPVLLFDSVIAIDYPFALCLWVVGSVCLRRASSPVAALIPFAVCIGSRLNFLIFVVLSILFIDGPDVASHSWLDRLRTRFPMLSATVFAGALFYLPIWITYKYHLSWISAALPEAQGRLGMILRFFYKVPLAFGLTQFLIICACVALACFSRPPGQHPAALKFTNLTNGDAIFLAVVTIANLLIFWQIPTNLYYLQPLILSVYLGFASLPVRFIEPTCVAIICLNYFNWFARPQLFAFQYKSDVTSCLPVVAIHSQFKPSFGQGRLGEHLINLRKNQCYVNSPQTIRGKDYSSVLLSGAPLKGSQ
jgi:hypothetical protein